MKRTLFTIAVIIALILPVQAQEKEEKLKKLERLEEEAGKVTPPDTLKAKTVIIAAEADTLGQEAEPLPADEGNLPADEGNLPADEGNLPADDGNLPADDAEEIMIDEEENMDIPGEGEDTTRITIGEIVTVEDTGDETVIRIGKKAVRILTDGDNAEIRMEDEEEDADEEFSTPGRRLFEGHLGGIELGFNSYSTGQWGRNPEMADDYLDLNTAKSSSFNIISPPVSLGLSRHIGIVSALGVSFNNYRFDNNNSVIPGDGGILEPFYPADGINYEKSKLATVYGVLPVILEAQIPVTYSSTLNIGAGIIGAVKLGSHTKVVYYSDGKQKDKNHDDFSLNVLRYGVTARAGYEMVQVYGTCYLSQMFEKGKGPELYPFEVGIALTIND